MYRFVFAGLLGTLGTGALGACAQEPATSTIEANVWRDGDDWADDAGTHPQVIRIISTLGRKCTAWLSSSNTLTTNAHCLVNATDFYGWTYDASQRNSSDAQYAALQAMGPSVGGFIHPLGGACVNAGDDCCWGADMAVLVFGTPVPRDILRPLRLIGATADEPECSGSDTCITMIGTGRIEEDTCGGDAPGPVDSGATQLFVESGLGDGHCPANGDMLYGEYDYDDSESCKGDSGSPIFWQGTDEIMAQGRGTGGDGGDDVVGPILWINGPNTARDFYMQRGADQDTDGIQAADDNCDRDYNPTQANWNGDDYGDVCQDSDGDSLRDDRELTNGTNPGLADSDGDGLIDPEEYLVATDPTDPDSDDDGIIDGVEVNVLHSNPLDDDTDNDDLRDGLEYERGTDLNDPDTDDDGLNDGSEFYGYHTDPAKPDTDGDYLDDREELFDYLTDPLDWDTDGDSASDGAEARYLGTHPSIYDTDGNGIGDGYEDTDGDQLSDGVETRYLGSNPFDKDSDGDHLPDGLDVEWLIAAIQARPVTAFVSLGDRTTFINLLRDIETFAKDDNRDKARDYAISMAQFLDGCGVGPDADDWVVWCPDQFELRGLLALLASNY